VKEHLEDMSNSTWDLIHAERQRLIEDLQSLNDQQWRAASLCPEWDVQQVLAHLVALTKQTPPKFFAKFAASGFRFERMAAKDVARESAGTPAQTLAEFTAHVGDSSAPPGPVDSWIGEVATTRQVADFYKNSNLLIGAKSRISGVKMIATDTDWSHGSGAEVRGPILSLVQAMTGRVAAVADLTGDGVGTLRSKMPRA